jgi:hypothetical protein
VLTYINNSPDFEFVERPVMGGTFAPIMANIETSGIDVGVEYHSTGMEGKHQVAFNGI